MCFCTCMRLYYVCVLKMNILVSHFLSLLTFCFPCMPRSLKHQKRKKQHIEKRDQAASYLFKPVKHLTL